MYARMLCSIYLVALKMEGQKKYQTYLQHFLQNYVYNGIWNLFLCTNGTAEKLKYTMETIK